MPELLVKHLRDWTEKRYKPNPGGYLFLNSKGRRGRKVIPSRSNSLRLKTRNGVPWPPITSCELPRWKRFRMAVNCASLSLEESPNPPAWLLLVDDPRPADLLRDEADCNLDTVGDFDEGNAAIHPIVLAVESQCPLNIAGASPLTGKR
jgi:hypothetical protein